MAAVIAGLLCLPSGANAQTSQASLVNKTCRGTFLVPGPPSSKGMGSIQYRFSGTGAALKGHMWRAFGLAVWQQLTAEVNAKKLSTDMNGFEDIGDLVDFSGDGKRLKFKNDKGALYDMTFDSTYLTGTVDPRGVPGFENAVVANVRMFCE